MSNADLQAEVSALRSENARLHEEQMELQNGVSNAANQLSGYIHNAEEQLTDSNNRINSAHDSILRAYELQGEIDRLYHLFKNMEEANKKIRECNNKKIYDFQCFNNVRKIVSAMMDNLDLHLVSDRVIYSSIEKQHLLTPDYWLTCALLAIMAWKNGEKDLADRALDKACGLDLKNTSVFLMLFNIQMKREEAALKWLQTYEKTDLTGEDERTFLMLFSLACKTLQKEVNDDTRHEVTDFLNSVIALDADREDFSKQELTAWIVNCFKRMSDNTQEPGFDAMQKFCGDYSDTSHTMALARNNKNILQFIYDISNVKEAEKNRYITEFIEEEIAKPNSAEKQVYEEIEYNELIIADKGDVEKARQEYDAIKEKRSKKLELVFEMIRWIYGDNHDDIVRPEVRKNLFLLTYSLQQEGDTIYAEEYRSLVKSIHPVKIDDYQTEMDFEDLDGEQQKVSEYYKNIQQEELNAVSKKGFIIGGIITAAGVAAMIVLGLPFLILSAAGGGILLFSYLNNQHIRKSIDLECKRNITEKNKVCLQLFDEYHRWNQKFQEYDSYQEQIADAMNQF
jgi:hypothetical protein